MKGAKAKRPIIVVVTADPGSVTPGVCPSNAGKLALDKEVDDISRAVAFHAPHHDFELIFVRGVTVNELMQLLQKFSPEMLYFAGHGMAAGRSLGQRSAASRDIASFHCEGDGGIVLLDDRGRPCLVTARGLALMIHVAAPSMRILILNACHGAAQAETLCRVVDCVIAMDGAIRDDAARSFAGTLFRALGNRQPIGIAFALAQAALAAHGYPDEHLPRCYTRSGIDANRLFVADELRAQPVPVRRRAKRICLASAASALALAVAAATWWLVQARQAPGRKEAHDHGEVQERNEAQEHSDASRRGRAQSSDGARAHSHSEAQEHSDASSRGRAQSPDGAQGHAQGHSLTPDRAPPRNPRPLVSAPPRPAILPRAMGSVASSAPGELDRDTIRNYMRYHVGQVRHCYEKQRMARPELAGTVYARFYITPQGTVASSMAAGLDGEVASCVAGVIKDIAFPRSGVGTQVNYPFHFQPAEELAEPDEPRMATVDLRR